MRYVFADAVEHDGLTAGVPPAWRNILGAAAGPPHFSCAYWTCMQLPRPRTQPARRPLRHDEIRIRHTYASQSGKGGLALLAGPVETLSRGRQRGDRAPRLRILIGRAACREACGEHPRRNRPPNQRMLAIAHDALSACAPLRLRSDDFRFSVGSPPRPS